VVCQIAGVFPGSCDQSGSPCIAKTYRHQEDPNGWVVCYDFKLHKVTRISTLECLEAAAKGMPRGGHPGIIRSFRNNES